MSVWLRRFLFGNQTAWSLVWRSRRKNQRDRTRFRHRKCTIYKRVTMTRHFIPSEGVNRESEQEKRPFTVLLPNNNNRLASEQRGKKNVCWSATLEIQNWVFSYSKGNQWHHQSTLDIEITPYLSTSLSSFQWRKRTWRAIFPLSLPVSTDERRLI